MVPFQYERPVGFREVKVFGADVTARDTAGKAVSDRKLIELLATDTPVLLAPSADPIEPFYLLTTKAGTLVLHVDPAKLAPPKEAGPGPR